MGTGFVVVAVIVGWTEEVGIVMTDVLEDCMGICTWADMGICIDKEEGRINVEEAEEDCIAEV